MLKLMSALVIPSSVKLRRVERPPEIAMVRLPRDPPGRPGACAAGAKPKVTRLKKLRPFKGRSLMRASSMTVPTVASSVVS